MLLDMNDIQDAKSLGARLREARKRAGLTQSDVAERLRVTTQAVSQWETGANQTTIENPRKLAELYGVGIEWLTGQTSGELPTPSAANQSRVPKISKIRAGTWTETFSPYEPGDGDTFLYTEIKISGAAFALEIEGSSMEPTFSDGDWVIIDPRVHPRPGDFVAAKLENDDAATFKKFRQREEHVIELVPLNPDWPTLTIDHDHPGSIIGTMVEHRRFRRR